MSLASAFAASISAVTPPASFTGPGGLLTAKADENGNCQLNINGQVYTVAPAAVLAFATWVTTTFS